MDELLTRYLRNEAELQVIEEHITRTVSDLLTKQKQLQDQNELIRETIKQSMEKNKVEKYENDLIAITYVKPMQRVTVDSKKLKDKYKSIFYECSKTVEVKSSVRIKIKGQPDQNQIEENKQEQNELII